MNPRAMSALRVFCSAVACASLLTLASCSDDDDGGSKSVNVMLQEFSITLDRDSAHPGNVTFDVSNVGEDEHEFLVIRTDLAPDALPTEENGSYEEDGEGTVLLDEIESITPGNHAELTLDLEAGSYVLICNMVHVEDDGEVEVHYALGMRTAFTVG